MAHIERPGPLRWLGYAYGAGLPPRFREWVLRDVTTRTWFLRHLLRGLVQILPFGLAIGFLVPGTPAIRAAAVTMGAVIGLLFAAVFAEPAVEHRAIKAGYPEGTAEAARHERSRRRTRR